MRNRTDSHKVVVVKRTFVTVLYLLSWSNLSIGFNRQRPNIFVHVVDRVHRWYTRTLPSAFSHAALYSSGRSKQSQTFRQRKPCPTAQSCYAFNPRFIRFPRTLFIRHYPVLTPRLRVLLLRECIAEFAVGSLQGIHYPEPSFPTEAGPRYKWENHECSHCHVGSPTLPFAQLTISPIAYLRCPSLCIHSQGFLAPREWPQILPVPCDARLRSGTHLIESLARTDGAYR